MDENFVLDCGSLGPLVQVKLSECQVANAIENKICDVCFCCGPLKSQSNIESGLAWSADPLLSVCINNPIHQDLKQYSDLTDKHDADQGLGGTSCLARL